MNAVLGDRDEFGSNAPAAPCSIPSFFLLLPVITVYVLTYYTFIDYVVEKCESGSRFWEKVPGVVKGTQHEVQGLQEGKNYDFRVRAENMHGLSEPLVTDKKTLAKNPFGKT